MTHEIISEKEENCSGTLLRGLITARHQKSTTAVHCWSWDAPFLLCLTFYILHPHPLIRVFRLMSQDRGSSPRWPLGLVNFATVYFFQGARKSLQKGSAGWCWNLNLQNVQNDRNYRFRLWSRRNGGWFTVHWTGSIELNIFVFRAEEWWSD